MAVIIPMWQIKFKNLFFIRQGLEVSKLLYILFVSLMIAISEESSDDLKQIFLRSYFYLFNINSLM